ncbi:hypothetical protein [Actinacidiphila acididurans]|uniref:Lipoprotein n=1 Tax=Actinacidiphila acididurans TaxID=2784346 RepID=A0ABS2TMF6_9ACTN|nr:hypothetical protein [Actinacidiphila acididurans]MBM9503977.1 hypothetical protein [Actinacidiphila acididurans]
MIPDIPRPSRRRLLAVAAAGTVGTTAGCAPDSGSGHRAAPRPPGTAERTQALRDSAALLASYDAVIAAHPALAASLRPLRAEVARHVQAFGGTPAAPGHASTPAARSVPTLTSLVAMERTLADRRAATVLEVPGDLARLLASVAAAGAAHVVLLTAAQGRPGAVSGAGAG